MGGHTLLLQLLWLKEADVPHLDAKGHLKWRSSFQNGPPASQHKSGRRHYAVEAQTCSTHAELNGENPTAQTDSPAIEAAGVMASNGVADAELNEAGCTNSGAKPSCEASKGSSEDGIGHATSSPAQHALTAVYGNNSTLPVLNVRNGSHRLSVSAGFWDEGISDEVRLHVGGNGVQGAQDQNGPQADKSDDVSLHVGGAGRQGQQEEVADESGAEQGLLAGIPRSSGPIVPGDSIGSENISQQQEQQQQQQQQQQHHRSGGDHTELPGQESNFFKTQVNMLLDIYAVARGKEAKAFRLACLLAIFNQATASTAIINYAPTLLLRLSGSLSETTAQLFLAAIALTKVVGVGIGMCTVDRWGRRPLLMWGAAGCAVTMAAATAAYQGGSTLGLLACMCTFVLAFSMSWAGVYWVVVSECFSMGAKSPATSAATALLFLAGGLVDLVFQLLVDWLGGFCLLVFACMALCSGVYVWVYLPETKGKSLSTVQAIINGPGRKGLGEAGGQQQAMQLSAAL
ncbi:hypothetical protein DUNSADRAFT_10045 [Dunaliella salina]|uniref:Major facilitator superfamily (MFS) profile domain-containing protein n=1 Tax=Dunaliella salina TaxID=3046 RepID=A0ABQ7GG63_DUNSA|nr:hypothetical protein DUNSADRAFT_10045 [Dunaliella salina]|eukprot:KAF5833593.1 hypothetical protein DUNSADRAFT_10045 [Dunaliella salina]